MTNEQLEDLLYCMGMESETAWKHMQALCEKLGVTYPPTPGCEYCKHPLYTGTTCKNCGRKS
jgi:hypothetical protein